MVSPEENVYGDVHLLYIGREGYCVEVSERWCEDEVTGNWKRRQVLSCWARAIFACI